MIIHPLRILFLLLCLGLVMPSQRCKSCKKRHALPRGKDCPHVGPPEQPAEPIVRQFPPCSTCKNMHLPPRGKYCQYLPFGGVDDPFLDASSTQEEDIFTGCQTGSDTQVLTKVFDKLSEINTNFATMNQRVAALETPINPPTSNHRDLNGLEGGLRAHMQALNIDLVTPVPWEMNGRSLELGLHHQVKNN